MEEFLSKLRKQGEVPDKKLCVESPEGIPLTPMRKTIARRLVRSLQESAQVTAITEIDVSELVKLRDRTGLKKGNGKKTSWNAIFMKAIASAVGEHPILNSQLIDEKVYVFSTVAMGFAIDLPDGLVVPVIRNVEALEIEELDKRLVECVEKARTGQLSAGDMDGGNYFFQCRNARWIFSPYSQSAANCHCRRRKDLACAEGNRGRNCDSSGRVHKPYIRSSSSGWSRSFPFPHNPQAIP